MFSLILSTTTRFLITLLLLLPVFFLLRGHNLPGGGFIGALVATTAVSLYAIAFDVESTRKALRVDPRAFVGIGLLIALGSGVLSGLQGLPLFTGRWQLVEIPGFPELFLGTPLLFDLGVFVAVFGVSLTIIFALMEED